ncbi:hypothetical protein Droror1_Dr00003283 [Drosera rotundifolia]
MALHLSARLSQSIRRTLCVQLELINKSPTYCTQTTSALLSPSNLDSNDTIESNPCLSKNIERHPRSEPVGSVFQTWMGDGFPVHRGHIFHAINRLRKLKLNKRALEVMEWVIRERPYKPRELDFSYLLEFTMKLHGISRGEKLFSCVPSEFRNKLLYNNLVIACLDTGAIRLSLEYMKKMRELGHPISHLIFNRLIILHSLPSRRKTIPKLLAQMRADKVVPHVSTYNILLKIEADEHNIDGLVRVFDDMKRSGVEPNEITYCILATSHAAARLYTGKSRTWGILGLLSERGLMLDPSVSC